MNPTSKIDWSEQESINARGSKLIIPHVVTVVGTGGFGAWAAYFAAKAGVKKFILINPGTGGGPEDVHDREIILGPFNYPDKDKSKIDALTTLLSDAAPWTEVEGHSIVFDPAEHAELLKGVVFSGVSNTAIQQAVHAICRQKGLRCYTGCYSGLLAGIFSNYLPEAFSVEKELPAWVGSAALSAILAINAAFTVPFSFFGSIDDLAMTHDEISTRDTGNI